MSGRLIRRLDSVNREFMTGPQCSQKVYKRWEQAQATNGEFREIAQAYRDGVRKAKLKQS